MRMRDKPPSRRVPCACAVPATSAAAYLHRSQRTTVRISVCSASSEWLRVEESRAEAMPRKACAQDGAVHRLHGLLDPPARVRARAQILAADGEPALDVPLPSASLQARAVAPPETAHAPTVSPPRAILPLPIALLLTFVVVCALYRPLVRPSPVV
ncbi:hypothetical protein EVG20_g11561 [Dentipellis fragilis]|uniref:Uncharacterized protein n=1 Tax=Dentipellis fragilis TaxID=205917 RepID=A0A4Y9XL00_9AGAM|nr:hypothetical protein EVG20_g11561 [Dentipellis fragilis]